MLANMWDSVDWSKGKTIEVYYETQRAKVLERRHEDLLKLARFKYGKVPAWAEQMIRQSDMERMDQWVANFLISDNLEQIFRY